MLWVGLVYLGHERDNRNETVYLDELAEQLGLPEQYVSGLAAEASS